jgi:hypothetical protein
MVRIGFVILTHSCPDQIVRLVRTLNELYDGPPVVCHHDFGQCQLDRSQFPKNVTFVDPHFSTFWGCFSIIPATLAAMRTMMEQANPPDWIYLLSGSDYPAISPDRVLDMLSHTRFDAFIDHREIIYSKRVRRADPDGATGFSRSSYQALAYRRYCAISVPRPARSKPWAFPPVGHSYLYHPYWRSLLPGPFSPAFRCYAGEHWFTVSSKAVAVLLQDSRQSRRLLKYLSKRESPEECFYHSSLGNAQLNLSSNNLRYVHWPAPHAWHPSTLSLDHLAAIRDSGAHFVRKVEYDSLLSGELDRIAGISHTSFATRH